MRVHVSRTGPGSGFSRRVPNQLCCDGIQEIVESDGCSCYCAMQCSIPFQIEQGGCPDPIKNLRKQVKHPEESHRSPFGQHSLQSWLRPRQLTSAVLNFPCH